MLAASALLLLSLAVGSQIGLPSGTEKEKPAKHTWVFFRVGDRNRAELDAEQVKKWQEEHVGNLGTLWRAKTAGLAGPTGSAGDIRGIVIMAPRTEEDLKKDFAPDPFVRERLLKVDHFPMQSVEGLLHEGKEPFEIEQQSIVFLKLAEGAKAPTDVKAHRDYLASLRKAGQLGFFASSTTDHAIKGILILPIKELDAVKALAAEDPLVKSGHLVWSIHPQYLGKGVLRPKAGG